MTRYQTVGGCLVDAYDNWASIARFGSKEKAQRALASLVNCSRCVDCFNCSGCVDCFVCVDCVGLAKDYCLSGCIARN